MPGSTADVQNGHDPVSCVATAGAELGHVTGPAPPMASVLDNADA
jgi:hypothetical protein